MSRHAADAVGSAAADPGHGQRADRSPAADSDPRRLRSSPAPRRQTRP